MGKYARRAIDLSPYLNERFRKRGYQILHKFNGSQLESIPIDPSGEAGSNADFIQFSELWGAMDEAKSRMWCFDEETEILTYSGWKYYDELLITDAFATLNIDTGEFLWRLANSFFIDKYDGEMWHYKTDRIDMMVSPGHKILGRFTKVPQNFKFDEAPWELKSVEDSMEFLHGWTRGHSSDWCGIGEIPEYIFIPSTAFQKELKISFLLWIEFMAWFLSEGCVATSGGSPRTVLITQSKKVNPKNHKRIVDLIKKMGFNPKVYDNGRTIAIHNKSLATKLLKYGLSGEKYVPLYIKNLPQDHLSLFLQTYIDGDGSRERNRIVISTKSSKMLDDLAEVSQKCGYQISHRFRTDSRFKNNPPLYILYIVKPGKKRYKKIIPKNWKKVEYDGMIWCPSVKNGVVYVRRNGKYLWSGNSEMTLSPTKFGKSFRMVESYAGYVEESELLYDLWELGTQKGVQIWLDKKYAVYGGEPGEITEYTPLEVYKNEEARLLCLWNTQPRCPWQTAEYYAQEAAMLHPLEFDRMHRNQWVTQTDTFCPMEWYDSCQRSDEEWPEIPENWPMALTADAGTRKDNFGVLMTCRHPDREKYPHAVLVIYAKKWIPPAGARGLDYIGTEENPGPEMELRRLIDKNNVVVLAYDDHQLHDMMNRFRREHIVFCRRFPQGSGKHSRTISDGALYDKIRERKIWHRGEPELREHVQNANAKIDDQERRLRIVKRTKKLKVDLCVCLSMGAYEIHRLVV